MHLQVLGRVGARVPELVRADGDGAGPLAVASETKHPELEELPSSHERDRTKTDAKN